MVRLEETIRDLKKALRQKQINEEALAGVTTVEASKPYHLAKADEKIEELTRATAILTKTKDKD